jgi:hypothetical protein
MIWLLLVQADLVFISEGYTADELPRFRSDVDRCSRYLLQMKPFRDRASEFRVRTVELVSAESGADHPDLGLYRDTALGASYDGRLITISEWGTYFAAASGAAAAIVLVNDPQYGGAGYFNGPAVSYAGPAAPEVASHELGHSFGLLLDEYYADNLTHPPDEPPAANLTVLPDPPKWSDLVGFGGVGAYEGGRVLYARGVWRPTDESCQMRSFTGKFCNVCLRQINRRIGDSAGGYAPEAFSRADVTAGTAPLSVRFTGLVTDTDGPAALYRWDFGDGTVSDEASPSHAFASPGVYSVVLSASDGIRSVEAEPLVILVSSVDGGPFPPSRPVGPESGRKKTRYAYSAVSAGPPGRNLRYVFDWGDGRESTTPFRSPGVPVFADHKWRRPGTYSVRVRAEDAEGRLSEWSPVLEVVIAP